MPIRTQCPSCKAALGVPDGPARQRVRCPYCAAIFIVPAPDVTIPDFPPARGPATSDKLQRADPPRPVAVKRSAPPGIKPSTPKAAPTTPKAASGAAKILPKVPSAPKVLRKVARLPLGVLIGLGVGCAGMFMLLMGAVVLWLVLRSTGAPPSGEPQALEAVGTPNGDRLAPEASRQMARAPQAVPEATPTAEGDEVFVDLPERDEVVQTVGGLNPDPQPGEGGPGAPAVRPKIAITGARAARGGGRPGVYFEITYRFEQGAPAPGMRYGWVVVTRRRGAYKMPLTADKLHEQGTLSGHLKFVTSNLDAPFRIFLIAEMPGGQGMKEEKISNEMTIR